MRNYVNVNCDLYILKSDLIKLDKGEAVNGYKVVSNPAEYELVTRYAFIPAAIVVDENTLNVCTINKKECYE